jgi:outer membrane receptor for ferrienterochelin and colicins
MWFLVLFLLWSSPVWAKEVELPEIVVTATKTPHTLKDVPVETVVIDRDEIERSNALTVSNLLRYVPGFMVRAENLPGISAWRTRLRGFDLNSGYALVLVDGKRVKGGGMGEYGYGLNQIPPALIERIEVVKGPGSVLYGSDAVTGVINIITRKIPRSPYLEGLVRYGTYQTKMFDLTGGGPLVPERVGLLLSFDREETDRRKYGGPGDHYQRDHFFSKLSFRAREDLDLSLALKWEDRDRDYAHEEKFRLSPQGTYQIGRGRLSLGGYYYKWDFHHFTPGYTERKGHMYYRQVEGRLTYPWASHLFTVGAELLEEELDYNLANKTIDTRSLYLQDEISFGFLGHETSLLLGVRLDDHSTFGTELSPRGALMIRLFESMRLRAQIGRSFKSPTIRQLYYREPFLHHDYWIKSNPDLDAETSWGGSLGLEKFLPHGFSFLLTLFRHDVDDMVVRVETDQIIDGYPVKTYENVEEAYTQGVELSLKGEPLPWLRLALGYTYLDTENKDTGKDLPYCPKHTLGLRLGLTAPYGFSFEFGTQYVDEVYANTSNTKKIDDYWLTEAKVRKSLFEQAELFLEVDNLFDTDYGEPTRDWAGRTVFVGLRTRFR